MKMKFLLSAALAVRVIAAATLNVPAGGDLQGALNNAHPGDTIQLAAGATFTGHYTLPANPGSQWITIRSSALSSLPAGTRVSSTQAGLMPKIVTPDNNPVLTMTTGAQFYHLQGIEFTVAAGDYGNDLIEVGNATETSVAALPHDIDFDRDYIHGDPVAGTKRGIALNGANVTVQNCYLSAFTSNWQDTQALAGWNGSGPFTIVNNYLEAGTEIVAFGGDTTSINGAIPSDILIQNNSFVKPLAWMPGSPNYNGMHVWAKNHIELKNAQRVTIDSNTFDNNWVGADQHGFMLVFNVRLESGAVPWAVVNNVTVTNNILRHSAAGMVFVGEDGSTNNQGQAVNFTIKNNLLYDISSAWNNNNPIGGSGRLFQIQAHVQNLTIDHNTALEGGYLMVFDGDPSSNVNFTNNIVESAWGNAGNGLTNNAALAAYITSGTFTNNAIIGGSANNYPANNFFPASDSQVGFTSIANANYQLAPGTPYKNAGSDGKDLGQATTTSAQAPASLVPTGWVYLVSKNSGKCADVEGISTAPGAHVHQWTCWGGNNQKWQFAPVQGGFKISSMNSGLQMDVQGGPSATYDGALFTQYPYWGGSNEIFTVNPTADGYFTISPVSTGKCMDVSGISLADGAAIWQWSCWGGDNQKWSFVPAQ